MVNIKLGEIDLEFNETEIKKFLESEGYRLEEHKCSRGMIAGVSKKSTILLTLREDNEVISSNNDYKYVFKKEIKAFISNKVKKIILE